MLIHNKHYTVLRKITLHWPLRIEVWHYRNLFFLSNLNLNLSYNSFLLFRCTNRRTVLLRIKMPKNRSKKKSRNHHSREFHRSITFGIRICHENWMGKQQQKWNFTDFVRLIYVFFSCFILVRADSIYQRIHFWIRFPITMTLTSSATACTMAFMHP